MMKKLPIKENRTAPRFTLQNPVRLQGSTLPLVVRSIGTPRVVDGKIQNISSGGVCLVAGKELKPSEMLVAEIALPGTGASIPTLLQVRWRRKSPSGSGYRAGLHFVIETGIADVRQSPAQRGSSKKTTGGVKRKANKKTKQS